MVVLRKVIQQFTSKKRGALSAKKATYSRRRRKQNQDAIPSNTGCETLAIQRVWPFCQAAARAEGTIEAVSWRKKIPKSRSDHVLYQLFHGETSQIEPLHDGPSSDWKCQVSDPEQMHALDIDIFQPLDFYEIFFDRIKTKDEAIRGSEEVHDMRSLIIMVKNATG